VGFIRDLPPDLINAFSATLDELKEADLLLHVIDMSDPNFRNQISAVENILADLQLTGIPLIRVLNKEDKVDHKLINNFCRTYQAISISAKVKRNLLKLTERIECRFIDFDAERKSQYIPCPQTEV